MKRKLLYLSLIPFFLILGIAFFTKNIWAQSTGNYSIVSRLDESESISPEQKASLLSALNDRWNGTKPLENTFYLHSIRQEEAWALLELHYNLDVSETDSSLSNSFLMLMTRNPENIWESALSYEQRAAELAEFIPDQELDFNAKSTLFKFYPSAFKATATNISYKFPWSNSPTDFFFSGFRSQNSAPCVNNSAWHGAKAFHDGKSCHGLDFAPVLTKEITNSDILSPVTGYVSGICKNSGDLKQAAISIKASNSDESISLYHLHQASIPTEIKLGSFLNQGDYLGRMVEGSVNEKSSKCPLISEGTHIHIVAPNKPFKIDEYKFDENHKVTYSDKEYTMKEYQNVILNSSNSRNYASCSYTGSGDWNIRERCSVNNLVQVRGNITIQDGGELILERDSKLDLNFSTNKLLIKTGGKISINPGAKIY